mmetsp:Transcript_10602/g.22354  ORF Transcript_10602/g.22354 Transcript_10602/m.22354 type:complete len:140 (-) Transcript_10602:315-734(-)
MKCAIIATLVGFAAAFAPAPTGKASSTQLHSVAVLSQQPRPFGFFDRLSRQDVMIPVTSVQSPPATTDIGNDLQRATDQAIEPFIVIGMKVVSSIGKMKKRHKDCQVVRRRGKIFVICKSNPRFKVRQGGAKMKKRQKK